MKPPSITAVSSAAASYKPSTLEKVARAICGTDCFRQRILGEPCLNADRTNGPCKANMTQLHLGGPLQAARAALQSLRQVDDETVEAMARVFHVAGWLPNPKAEYQHLRDAITAAIDHILTEGGER